MRLPFVRAPLLDLCLDLRVPWHSRPSRLGARRLAGDFCVMKLGLPNQITAANAGERLGLAGKSRVGLSPRPGVAEFRR